MAEQLSVRAVFQATAASSEYVYTESRCVPIDIIRQIWGDFDFSYLISILLAAVPSLFCITLHETAHGLTALWLGDKTAQREGRLTLNPIKHLDLMGLLMLLVFHFGWAKPVPVNPRNFKNPKLGMSITALAGPLCNFLITVLFLFLYGLLFRRLSGHSTGELFLELIQMTAILSLGLCIFNLLPIPPLDGSKILAALLPRRLYYYLMLYERYGMILLLVLVWTGILGRPFNRLLSTIFRSLMSIASFSAGLI